MTSDEFWQAYLESLPDRQSEGLLKPEAWHFCDNQADADECAALVLAGSKRGTSSLVEEYQAEGEALPQPGDMALITRWSGMAVALIRIVKVDILPFAQVSAEHARIEGEGDGSLAYWQKVHEAAFGRTCESLGIALEPETMVVFEQFELLWS